MKSLPQPHSHWHRDAAPTLPTLKLSMPLPTFLLAALFSLGLQVAVFAQSSVSLVKTLPSGQTLFSDTVGYKFTVGSKPLKVSALGVASGGPWLSLQHFNQVGLWNEAGELIASAKMYLGADLENGFSWKELAAPVTLSANSSYIIGACGPENFSQYWFNGALELSSDVSLVGFAKNNQQGVFSKPSLNLGWGIPASQGAVGANIKYSVEDAPSPSAEMVTVQGGTLPSSSQLAGQTVGTFQIARTEVTWGEWKTVRDWAVANGYTDLAGVGGTYPSGSAGNFPVVSVSWYDVVKWCNAKSQKEGLTPVYQVSGATYKTGQSDPTINSSANGYRLPCEKEWEWAARGGVSSQGYIYSGSNDVNRVAWTYANSSGGTKAVGTKAANELGIYDMSGNAWERCEDSAYVSNRRIRGGSLVDDANDAAVAFRGDSDYPADRNSSVGFRLARNAEPPADTTAPVITLSGVNPQEIYKGSTYTDPGAVVTDNVDAPRTIQGSGTVSTSVLGVYTITYAATDAAGNAAEPVARTINVVLDQSEMVSVAEGTIKISKFEVSWSEWSAVKSWAESNGYGFDNTGSGDPVQTVSWFDVLKWCNAKSQMEGKTPVYETTLFGAGSSKVIYKSGKSGYYNVGIITINNSAEGYFIPSAQGWDNYVKNGAGLGVSKKNPVLFEWCWDRPGGGLSYDYRIIKNLNSSDKKEPQKNDNGNVKKIGFRYAVQSTPSPADTTAPVIAITSISANARLTSANATFGGTITEAGSKPTLQYRLGTTGNWTASTVGGSASPYSFSQLVALKPGPNTVQFQAQDDAGNTSVLASVNVSYVVASTLTITAPNAADGTVTSGFGGSTSREVGVNYSVTATPASGMLFKEWLKNGVSTSTNATLTFTMQPGLTLKPVFVPDFAKLGGFYNGLIGMGAIGSGSAADMQAFATNNGFLQITSGANGALSGVLKIEGKSHSFNGTMGANKRATITVPRPGKGNATLSLNLVSALPGEISGNVSTSGAPLAFRALRAAYTAGAAKHALAGKRYAIVLPPPSGLAMGYGHATLTVEDNGAAVLSGVLANGQAVNTGARIVDDGAGNWVFPVYVGGSGIFTGEIVIPKTTPASGSEIGGSLEWLKPASNTGLFKSGFLKSLQPLGATHSTTSAGLGGAAFSLTLDPAKLILPAAVVQPGTWANSGSPSLATPVKNGLTLSFNPLSGKFEGSFTRTVNSAPLPTPIQGTLFSRPITIPGGATLRGAGFFTSGNASTAVEVTSNATVTPSANMVTVQGGTLPSISRFVGQTVSTFQIGKYEVTWGEWKEVRDWGVANGYPDLAEIGGTYPDASADNFPVCYVNWYDVVKWCNARSQKEGLLPVYEVNGTTYKNGEGFNVTQKAGSNGYRLPNEKEWEWVARGGVKTRGYTYSGSNDLKAVAWTSENSIDGTKAVGVKAANELGIFDMSGNVWEWCWDIYLDTSDRVFRGGSWNNGAEGADLSRRGSYFPADRSSSFGFRLARNAGN